MIIGSFGASAVLIYGHTHSPLAQPRNFIGGHLVSAVVGVTFNLALTDIVPALACAGAVASSILFMHITNTLHPPGGATALIGAMISREIWFGYFFVFMPVATGTFTMAIVAILVNNLSSKRNYPTFWW